MKEISNLYKQCTYIATFYLLLVQLLKAYALECPRYSELRQEDEQSLEYKEREEMYKVCLLCCLSACLSVCVSVCLPVCRCVCLPVSLCCLPTCLSVCLSVCRLSVCFSMVSVCRCLFSVQDFLSKVQENTGLVPTTLSNVWMVQDTLLVEVSLNCCVS